MDIVPILMVSPVIISVLLIISYTFLRKKYQWPLDLFIAYTFFWGLVFFILAFILLMIWSAILKSGNGPLAIIFWGPAGITIGELVGFALFLRAHRKNKTSNKESSHQANNLFTPSAPSHPTVASPKSPLPPPIPKEGIRLHLEATGQTLLALNNYWA